MTQPANTATDAQKPSEVAAPVVVGTGRASKRAALVEPQRDPDAGTPTMAVMLDETMTSNTVGLVEQSASASHPQSVRPETVTLPLALLTEALTVLTIYAEVAVPVASYRGVPLQAHAPRELVERIHRAIGV